MLNQSTIALVRLPLAFCVLLSCGGSTASTAAKTGKPETAESSLWELEKRKQITEAKSRQEVKTLCSDVLRFDIGAAAKKRVAEACQDKLSDFGLPEHDPTKPVFCAGRLGGRSDAIEKQVIEACRSTQIGVTSVRKPVEVGWAKPTSP